MSTAAVATLATTQATSVVVLDRGNNTTCTINLHGATVVSWRVNNQEQLFVSKLASFDGKKAIRGGIPFVFPQFGTWSYGPQHGFARISRWNLERSPERLHNGDMEAIFSLMDNEFTRSMWNYQFRITYRLILREKELHFHIGVYNPSKDLSFTFNTLLHTYLKVPDVRRCQITGLHGCTFIDKTREGTIYQEGREIVTVGEWTDRIYQHTPQEHIITNVVSGRKMRLQKYNFPDTVIWNPWIDHAREISDFGDDEFPNMLCIESGHVSSPVILLPGTSFEASQILQDRPNNTEGVTILVKAHLSQQTTGLQQPTGNNNLPATTNGYNNCQQPHHQEQQDHQELRRQRPTERLLAG
ncbi:uncharacterized protein [Eurosta solidaginis]|uniref:uncharacterized protein isoform X3 n=1 Tax=Eurosta solidaginis TaxID=178769 RepID=UPI003530D16A